MTRAWRGLFAAFTRGSGARRTSDGRRRRRADTFAVDQYTQE
jgi:hypothetical protein